MRKWLALSCLLIAFTSSAIACDRPIGPEVFCGTYRAGPKTTFYKINRQIADFEIYANVKDLIQALPKDQSMRTRYDWGLKTAPKTRVVEERHNVEVTEGY